MDLSKVVLPAIQSAIDSQEGYALAGLAYGNRVLELGTHFGKSAIIMAQTALKVHTVDNHRGDSTISYAGDVAVPPFIEPFFTNLHKYGLSGKVVVHIGDFDDVVTRFGPRTFDFVFHDGDHTYEAVAHDLDLVHTLIVPGGRLAVHDYGRPGMDGVKQAVDDHCMKHAHAIKVVDVVNTLAVVQYP